MSHDIHLNTVYRLPVCCICTQAQYIFLYDAISEGTTSGGTELPVTSLPGRMKELEQVDTDGETGYQKEFNVRT